MAEIDDEAIGASGPGADTGPGIGVSPWREVLAISRPRSWIETALPFLAAAFAVERGVTAAIILGTLYFLGPYGLLLHGLDVVVGGPPERSRPMRIAIAVTNLPLLIAIVVLSGAAAGVGFALAVLVAIVATTPPLQTKQRPVADLVTDALRVVVPAACGFLVAGVAIADLPWLALLAFLAWAAASGAIAAIGRRTADRAAGLASTATAFGARATAVVSLAGYVVAAGVVATQGRAGALVALALDVYLLLPAMVLLASRRDDAAIEAAAQRAWAAFRGLNVLVGAWIGLLFLRDWDVLGFSSWEIAIFTTAAAVAYTAFNVVATRLATRRRRIRRGTDDQEIEAVTIVVPCRDEGRHLVDGLLSLMDQTYADTTILVVDDGSTDGSADIAAETLGEDGRVVVAPSKPDGWTGKSWACQVGADASSGDLILFVDADTELVPVAVRILVEQLHARRLDLLSGLTRDAMPTSGERARIPGFALLLLGFTPIWLAGLTRGRLVGAAFAYGPLMLVRREAYEATGGHAATPDSLRDDIDLAQRFARAGRRVGTVHAADLGMTRRDGAGASVVATWRRIFLPYAAGSLALAIATMLLETLAFVVPFVLPPLAMLSDAGTRTVVASFVPLLLLVAMRVALTITQRQPVTTILWHPVTIGYTLLGQLAGLVDHVIGRPPRWRGRILDLPGVASPESPI